MPEGTRVSACVEKLKGRKGINPYAVCQASTQQSYATGKAIKVRRDADAHAARMKGRK